MMSKVAAGKLLVGLMMITLLFSACKTESIPTDSKSGFQSIEEIKAILGRVKPGQPQSHIKQLIGDQFVEFENPDGSVEWRYDFGTDKNYTFGHESAHEGKADVTGIEQEKVLAQLFIRWDKAATVEYVSMFYKGVDNKIHIYEMMQDGSSKETIE